MLNSTEYQLREELTRANTYCEQMRTHVKNMEAEYAKSLKMNGNELHAANQQLVEAARKMNEYELHINQLIVNKNNLAIQYNAEYSQLSQKFFNSLKVVEMKLKKLNEQLSLEKQQSDLLRIFNANLEKFTNDFQAEKLDEIKELKRTNEAHETQIINLERQLKDKSVFAEDLFNQLKSLTLFNTNFEIHYKNKKDIFQATEKENKELESKLNDANLIQEQLRKENSRLILENTQLRLVDSFNTQHNIKNEMLTPRV